MISTSSYKNFETGMYRRCSISFDKGKDAGYEGDSYPALAPKREFWDVWKLIEERFQKRKILDII